MKQKQREEPLELNIVGLVPLRGLGSGCKCLALRRTDSGVRDLVKVISEFQFARAPISVQFQLTESPDWFLESLKREYEIRDYRSMTISLVEPNEEVQKWSIHIVEGEVHLLLTARHAQEVIEVFVDSSDDFLTGPLENKKLLESLGSLDKRSERLWVI